MTPMRRHEFNLFVGVICALAMVASTGWSKPSTPAVQAKPAVEEDDTDAQSAGEVSNQQMDGFTMAGYAPDGTKRWELEGTGATVEGNLVSINRPNGVGYELAQLADLPAPTRDNSQPSASAQAGTASKRTSTGRTAYLTASLAQVDQSNHRVHLEQDVTIHTSDGFWVTSPTMYWVPDQNQLVTDQSVRMETDHMLLRGRGSTGNTQSKLVTVFRDIELLLNPGSEQTVPGVPGPPGSGGGGHSHVRITCDGPLTFDYDRYIATFERHVHVQDAQSDMYSDKLVAYLNKGDRTIRYAEATGHVRIIQGSHTAASQRAIYEPAIGKATLLGSPSLLITQDHGQATPGSTAPLGIAETGMLGMGSPRRNPVANAMMKKSQQETAP